MPITTLSSLKPFLRFDWKPYEAAWLVVFSSLALSQVVLYEASWFTFSVFLSGIFCVVLAAKGHIANYPAGLYNCFGYAWIAYENGLYGEMGLNLFFFVPMAVVGLLLWRKRWGGNRVRMRSLAGSARLLLALALGAATVALGYCLSAIAGQNTPYIDASTNALSVAAAILMALRFREQWLLYILLNVLSIVMWSYRHFSGSPEGLIMLVMWCAYLVNSIFGWWNWSRGARQDGQTTGPTEVRKCPKPA